MRILLIEDEKNTALTIKEELQTDFIVELAFTGKQGEYLAHTNDYDLIIIDYLLPDTDGVTLCEALRKIGVKNPILMLTGQQEVEKKVQALDAGADDYLTKPFRIEELMARIRALLRRSPVTFIPNTLAVDDLTLDPGKKIVKRKELLISLRRKEFHLLEYLMRNAGQIITRDMILNHIWDSENDSITNIVDVHIKYLRDKVDKPFEKKLIKTVYGLGYKLEA